MKAAVKAAATIVMTLVCASSQLAAQHGGRGVQPMIMPGMAMFGPLGVPLSRMGSGTSWLPDSSPTRAADRMWGPWMIMGEGAMHLQYDDQRTKRGDRQLGVTDWEMLMAMRAAGGGLLHLHAMTSLEPLILGGAGYPLLLQTGGTYQHSFLHDRQHPHELLIEVAAMYERSFSDHLAYSLYAAAVGEPALGPVAYMHRPSAQNDPLAPLGHHWQDATHVSFGVVTLGINTRTIKIEGSAFNPREPDEHHLVVDYRGAKLDSYAGRISWAATPQVVSSAWWAYLDSHGRLDPTTRMHRYGASVLTQRNGLGGGQWTSTFLWAMNLHHHDGSSHLLLHGGPGASPHHHSSSMLAETNLEIGTRTAVFARIEGVRKNGEEVGFQGGDLTILYDVRSYVAGVTRQMATIGGAEFGLGARGSVNFIAQTLEATYGTRTPAGFAVYAQLRPIKRR